MDEATCAACGGSRSSHFDDQGNSTTRHVFTEVPGQLVTKEQQEKAQPQRIAFNPAMLGGGSVQTTRLVEVLLEKNLLNTDEALYIAGMRPKLGGGQ